MRTDIATTPASTSARQLPRSPLERALDLAEGAFQVADLDQQVKFLRGCGIATVETVLQHARAES